MRTRSNILKKTTKRATAVRLMLDPLSLFSFVRVVMDRQIILII